MEKKIKMHNEEIRRLLGEKERLTDVIDQKRSEIGDALKFEEIKAFMKANNLERIWFRDAYGISKVYGGKPFDFDALSLNLKAIGSVDSTHLMNLLSNVGTATYDQRMTYKGDMNTTLTRIIVYTFDKIPE